MGKRLNLRKVVISRREERVVGGVGYQISATSCLLKQKLSEVNIQTCVTCGPCTIVYTYCDLKYISINKRKYS